MHIACLAHLILLDLITLIIVGEEYTWNYFKSWSSTLWRRIVMWQDSNVLEGHAASNFRMKWTEGAKSSETMVSCHVTLRYHKPPDHDVNIHCRKNSKSRIWNPSWYYFIHCPATSSILGPNILLRTCSQTPSIFVLPIGRETKFHTLIRTGKITVYWFYVRRTFSSNVGIPKVLM